MKLKGVCLLTIILLTLQLPILGICAQEEEHIDYDEDRRAMLNYYVSQTTQHGYYLLTLSVAFFGALTFLTRIEYSRLKHKLLTILLSSLLFGFIFMSYIYMGGRALFYGYLTDSIIAVSDETVRSYKTANSTKMLDLTRAAIDYMKTNLPNKPLKNLAVYFSGARDLIPFIFYFALPIALGLFLAQLWWFGWFSEFKNWCKKL